MHTHKINCIAVKGSFYEISISSTKLVLHYACDNYSPLKTFCPSLGNVPDVSSLLLRARLPLFHRNCAVDNKFRIHHHSKYLIFLFEHIVPKSDWQTWCPPWPLSSYTSVICSSQFFCCTMFLLYHWFVLRYQLVLLKDPETKVFPRLPSFFLQI